MTRHALTFAVGMLVAGLVGTAMAAVPDSSPFAWPAAPAASADAIDLPPVPPPPGRKTDRAPRVVGTPRADIVLRAAPATVAPCPDKTDRLPHTGTREA
jgi:hypothetical protein